MRTETQCHPVSIIGLGNELRGDDGVGVHAVRHLRHQLPETIPCLEIGTAILQAQDLCEQSQTVIAIDAVQAQGSPGDIVLLEAEDARLPRTDSLHHLSLPGLLQLLPPSRRPYTLVVGIEPSSLDYALQLSDVIQKTLPKVYHLIHRLVDYYAQGPVPITEWLTHPASEVS